MTLCRTLVVTFALLLTACGRGPTPPTPGEAARNPQSRDEAIETRLAVLSPALAATLIELNLGDLIVAKHDYDTLAGDDIPAVGHNEAIDYEALLNTEPTHILVEESRAGVPTRLQQLAADRDWTIRTFPLLTLDDIARAADNLALSFGAATFDNTSAPTPGPIPGVDTFRDPSERLGQDLPSASLVRALQPIETVDQIGPVLLLASVDPPAAVGPGSFHHDILVRTGATPALTEGSPWMELDAEDILRLAPAAIVLIDPRPLDAAPGDAGPEATRARLGVLADLPIPANEHDHLATIDDPLALLPGLTIVRFAEDLRQTLERWAE